MQPLLGLYNNRCSSYQNLQLGLILTADWYADSSSEVTMQPQPTEKEIQFILDAIAEYLTVKASSGR